MITFCLILLIGIWDRLRGCTSFLPNVVDKCILGLLVLCTLLGIQETFHALSNWHFALAYFVLFYDKTGWGTAIGAGLQNLTKKEYIDKVAYDKAHGGVEFYIRGPFARSWRLALAYRGFQWGFLPALAVWYWIGLTPALILTAAYTMAMPLGLLIALAMKGAQSDKVVDHLSCLLSHEVYPSKDRWGHQELYRGWSLGVLLVLLTALCKPPVVLTETKVVEIPGKVEVPVCPQVVVEKEIKVPTAVLPPKQKDCVVSGVSVTTIEREIRSATPEEAEMLK